MRGGLALVSVFLLCEVDLATCLFQMIIATPARLNDIIDNHPSDIVLADIEALVLDEVDCLLQMGFEPQVLCTLLCYTYYICA